jgi:hypothetical protein
VVKTNYARAREGRPFCLGELEAVPGDRASQHRNEYAGHDCSNDKIDDEGTHLQCRVCANSNNRMVNARLAAGGGGVRARGSPTRKAVLPGGATVAQ